MAEELRGGGEGLTEEVSHVRVAAKLLSEEELVGFLEEAVDNQTLLEERLAELELALEDRDWVRLGEEGALDFAPWALKRIIRNARFAYLHNPLINHGVEVKTDYVWAKEISIKADDEAAQKLCERFMAHPRNMRVLTDFEAQIERDQQLDMEGNLFMPLISGPNGDTIVRVLPTEEIIDGGIVRNPQDRAEVWFYHRVWHERTDADATEKTRHDYYPDIRYTPEQGQRPTRYGKGDQEGEIHWDMPTLHMKDGGLPGGKFGIPTLYQSIDWAREVKRDLEAYATIRRALASFAFKLKTKGGKGAVGAAKARLDSMLKGDETDSFPDSNAPPPMGSTWIEGDGRELMPFRTAGAIPSPEEGRRLWNMTGAGMGLPETILAGDADVGNLATASTLDRPTELMMKRRQRRWVAAYQTIFQFVILRKASGENTPDLNQPELPQVVVTFPPLLERDPAAVLDALLSAMTYDQKPLSDWAKQRPRIVAKLLLQAAGVEDVDDILDEFFDGKAEGGEKELLDKAEAAAEQMAAVAAQAPAPPQGATEEAARLLLTEMVAKRRDAARANGGG